MTIQPRAALPDNAASGVLTFAAPAPVPCPLARAHQGSVRCG